MIPGWPYSLVAALEPGRTSWTRLLDAVRLGPDDDLAAVTAAQVRGVIERIIAAGHWHDGDPDIMVIFDAGYEPARLAWLLRDLPVRVLGRLGTNRVLRQAPPPRRPGQMGPPMRHGRELKLSDDAACPGPDVHTTTQTSRYGAADARAWHRMHPKLKARGAWAGHQGELPVIEGTLIKLTVEHLPHDRAPEPVWLWASCPDADPDEVNRCWQAFLRRFDIEHTAVQAGPGLDRPEDPRPRGRGPVDLADHRLPRPALARPRPGCRPAPALAAPGPARPPDPRTGPAGIPGHPRHTARSHSRTETRQTRPRQTSRLEEPAPGHPSRRGQGRHQEDDTRKPRRARAAFGRAITRPKVCGPARERLNRELEAENAFLKKRQRAS